MTMPMPTAPINPMSLSNSNVWFIHLTRQFKQRQGFCRSIRVADMLLDDQPVAAIAVVPDHANHYPRAVKGEVGLLEGWTLGHIVADIVRQDRDKPVKRAIIAIIDTSGQAYGRREEAFGIHLALAAAAGAYATARQTGHPVIGLIVGKATSDAFLAHGFQANRLIALNNTDVMVHAMRKASAARITRRTVDSLEKLAATIPPMAYNISNFATLGLLEEVIEVKNLKEPTEAEITTVVTAIKKAIEAARKDTSLKNRSGLPHRQSTSLVRERMRKQW